MPTDPDLTDEEINRICAGLKQGHAMARFLSAMIHAGCQ